MDTPEGFVFDGAKLTNCPKDFCGAFAIPDGVEAVGFGAFGDCVGLTAIHIPESVTSIGWSAFSGCTSLKSVTIPESGTRMGLEAFHGCRRLSYAVISPECSVGERDFPSSCELISHEEHRRRIAARLAGERAGDVVEAVGMHAPDGRLPGDLTDAVSVPSITCHGSP